MYTEITTVQEAMNRYKNPFDLEKMKAALSIVPNEVSSGMVALAELQVLVWSINNDDPKEPEFKPDYNNGNQDKWGNWWRGGDESGAGFRFFDSYYVWTDSYANGGARLALKDEPRTLHMAKYFPEQYKALLLILK